jgi:hypothetical protein
MNRFKIGDWVRNIKDVSWIKQLVEVDVLAFNGHPDYCNLGEQFEPWQPQPEEWCWFWSEGSARPTLAQYKGGGFTAKFRAIESTQFHDYTDYDKCEPFIGTLPSFIKEKQDD